MKDGPTAASAEHATPSRDLRQHPRYVVQFSAHLETAGRSFTCSVIDLSLGGARLRVGCPLRSGQFVVLVIKDVATVPAQIVWQGDADGIRTAGVRFIDLSPEARLALTQELAHRNGEAG